MYCLSKGTYVIVLAKTTLILPKGSLKHTDRYKRSLYFTFRYIDDILSLNNSKLFDFVDCIYPSELEAKDTLCLFMH